MTFPLQPFLYDCVFSVPPLCGSIPPAANYAPDPGDHVSQAGA